MEAVLAALVRELKTLRKGRGLYVRQISERVGPTLRQVCNVLASDGPAEIRRKVSDQLETLAGALPEDLNTAIMAAFAINPEARLPFYQDRVRWTADHLQRDDRTARRRIDEGIERLAELAAGLAGESPQYADQTPSDWHTDELRIALVLDQTTPEAFELRRVIADRDELAELDLAMTLTAAPERNSPVGVDELKVDVFFGGRLIKKIKESTDRFGFVLELPKPLHREEKYDFALRYKVSNGQMQPHYVCVPKHRCDLFDLRVRFDPKRMPAQIWRVSDAFQRDVDDPNPSGDVLSSDASGEVHTVFRRLTPGRAYGIRWA
jgi:hypothetical protein